MRAIAELAEAREKMLASEAARSSRRRRGDAPEGWVIYLADDISFKAGKSTEDGATGSAEPAPLFGPLLTPPASGPAAAKRNGDPFMDRVLVDNIPRWTSLVAAVYTAAEPREPYKLVRRLIEELNPEKDADLGAAGQTADRLFAQVDLMPEHESAGREDIFLPWIRLPEQILDDEYRRFVLRLPFRELDVRPPDEEGKGGGS
jgi:hypothetical protein